MTPAEIERAFESKKRVLENQNRQRANFDYILADLIGRSVARIYNSNNRLPDISEVYTELFSSAEQQEQIQERKDELTAMRFKQFANSYNKKFEEVANTEWTKN